MTRTSRAFAAAVTAALILACAPSTKLTAVWRTPQPVVAQFKKVLVAAQTGNITHRRSMETALVRRISNSVPSYELLTDAEVKDPARAKLRLASEGFDGAVIVRLVSVDQQTTYVPGTAYWGPAPYGTMWGYWGYGWGAVYEPGYLTTDKVVTLESNVYSVPRDQLIWSSRSETVNPGSVDALVDSLVAATVSEMRKQKIL